MNVRLCILMVVLCAGFCLASPPQPPPPRSFSKDQACRLFAWPLTTTVAFEVLKQTTIFAHERVHRGGFSSPQVAAFNVLLDQPDAVESFRLLARQGGPVGRLYALCGFQVLKSADRISLGADLRLDSRSVYTQNGCIGGEQSVGAIAVDIDKYNLGKYFRGARVRTYEYYDRLAHPAAPCR